MDRYPIPEHTLTLFLLVSSLLFFTPGRRNRMDIMTFRENFTQKSHATFLCYEVEEGGDLVPENQRMDFLKNQGRNMGIPIHAEVLFLDKVHSWNLDPEVTCRITCFISWSPCPKCAWDLKDFLREHPKVELDIRAAHIYDYWAGFELGLQALRAAGANISIMTRAGTISDENINCETMRLKNIFRESVVLPPQSPALSSEANQDD